MTRARWRLVLWGSMLALVAYFVWAARTGLIPFAIGALFAYVLTPVLDRAASIVPPRSQRVELYKRGVIVLLMYVLIGGGMFAAGSALIPVAADQVVEFVDTLPAIVEDAREEGTKWLTQYESRVPDEVRERLDGYAGDASAAGADAAAGMARGALGVLTGTIAVLFGFAVVPFWMFYAMRDRHRVGRNFMNAVPEGIRDDVRNVLAIGDRLLIRYVRGQLLLGLIVGTAVGVGLTLMDVQLSLALGVIAGVTELVPIIGPWLGAVPGMLIVLGTDPDKLLLVGLLYVVVQQVENFLLVPRVQGHALDIHPAMVLMLLVVGGSTFGLWGLLVIVPLAAVLREVFWYADARLRGVDPSVAFAPGRAAPALPTAAPAAGAEPVADVAAAPGRAGDADAPGSARAAGDTDS